MCCQGRGRNESKVGGPVQKFQNYMAEQAVLNDKISFLSQSTRTKKLLKKLIAEGWRT